MFANKIVVGLLVTLLALVATGCQTAPSQQQNGTIIGGVLGGVLGSNVGKGRGQTAATIVGALAGALIGSEIGKSMDYNDSLRAQHVMESNKVNQTSSWHNPDTGNNVTVTPMRTYQDSQGRYCREYNTTVIVGTEHQNAYGTACRQEDGSWKL